MKKILLLAALLLVAAPQMHAKGDEEEVKIVLVKEENSDNYYYEGIVPVEGVSKEEMFKRAKNWVLSNFKTGDNNVQFDEENMEIFNAPTIIIKASSKDRDDYVNFKIKLLFKDGKYKFRFDNIAITSNALTLPVGPTPYKEEKKMFPRVLGKYNKNLIKNINIAFYQMAIEMENAIKATGSKKDDW